MNPSTEFEIFTQIVYQMLLNNVVLKPTDVRHDVKLLGKSGCEHQIDVYWEYEIAGIPQRVAIECKNYDSLVPIGKVRDFLGVLHDLSDVRGIMVSSKGYQVGAKKYADYYGISLKELRRPAKNEHIGTITTVSHSDVIQCLYHVDEGWSTEHGIDLDLIRNFNAAFQPTKADYWKTADYLPIGTKDHVIRNSKGRPISSLEDLEKQISFNSSQDGSVIIPFEDGWIDSIGWGPVKIREVKIEYDHKVKETTIYLEAEDFVSAILKDAISGTTNYIPKY